MARILVIEDDFEVRTVIRRMIENEGHEVIEAPDGEVGTRIYREQSADLIITDILMPEKEGIETIIELRREFPEVKIIAISGGGKVGSSDYLTLAKKLGATTTLPKPFSGKDLIATVQKHLTDSQEPPV